MRLTHRSVELERTVTLGDWRRCGRAVPVGDNVVLGRTVTLKKWGSGKRWMRLRRRHGGAGRCRRGRRCDVAVRTER